MEACCRAGPCEEVFGPKLAAWDLRVYRRRGLGRLQRAMLASVPSTQVKGARVLEIGGGIGVLQAELLRRGAASGEVIELVGAYAPYATELASELGVADRSSFRVADVLADPATTAPADAVLLDKVICCSPEGLELVRVAAGLTLGTLVLSYPRPTPLVRFAAWAQDLWFRLARRSYRFYVRPAGAIAAAAAAQGLEKVGSGRSGIWEHATFSRPRGRSVLPTETGTGTPTEKPAEIPTEIPAEIAAGTSTEGPAEGPARAPAKPPTKAPTKEPA